MILPSNENKFYLMIEPYAFNLKPMHELRIDLKTPFAYAATIWINIVAWMQHGQWVFGLEQILAIIVTAITSVHLITKIRRERLEMQKLDEEIRRMKGV